MQNADRILMTFCRRPLLLLLPLTMLLLLCLCGAAQASEALAAQDITTQCLFDGRGGKHHRLCDQNYATVWTSSKHDGEFWTRITAPENQTVGGLLIRWADTPRAVDVQIQAANGEWQTVAGCDALFYAQYIAIPALADFRILVRGEPQQKMQIAEITVLTPGVLPEDVQVWQKPGAKVDMMMLIAHPDDEVLWFGGLIPYYAGERGKALLVVCATAKQPYRRLELLDCLWTCGDTLYPVFCELPDYVGKTLEWLLDAWDYDRLLSLYTGLYRQYKPDVVVLHDLMGEYGHNAHRAMSVVGSACADLAADPAQYPESAQAYGVWDVPKIYTHLYQENVIHMDWSVPLTAFGGMSAQDVARLGFAKHSSQAGNHKVKDGGLYDNAWFGLSRTKVGLDIAKDDLFEHIE